jgi:hypothetical protein
MSALATIAREVAGLFVEDGSLALATVGLVALAIAAAALGAPADAVGLLLIAGSLAVLTENILRARRNAEPTPPK